MSQGVDDVDTETCVARRTLVVFLRHFWCANCQDYMVALAQGVHEADAAPCPSCDGSAKAQDHENASTISSPLASTSITTSNDRANTTPFSVPNSFVSEIPILPNISVASPPTLNSNAPSNHLSFSESSLFPYFPSLPCPELILKPDAPAESAPSRASNATDANTEEDECVSNDSVTFGYLQDLDFVRKSWGVGLHSRLGSGSDAGGAKVKVTSLKQQAARLSDEEFPDDHQTSECTGGSKTHLLIVAPGSHTLAARYLASFGFPTVDSCVGGEDGSTWDLEDASSTPRSSSASKTMVKEREKSVCGHKGIASIRIFVDPCPAEGVYTALGMGYAPHGPASPRSAVAVPSFVKSMDMAVTEGEFRSPETNAHNQQGLSYIGSQIAASSVMDPSAQETDSGPDQNDLHAEPASYVTHGIVSGLGAVILRALRAGMPMWGRGGDVRLLGGEFVFECRPANDASDISLRCTYAHRMQNPRGHASVSRILAAAGVHVPSPSVWNDRSGRLVRRPGKDKDAQRLVRALSNSGRQRTLSRSFGKSLSRNLNSSSTALDAQSRTSSSAFPRSVSPTTASSAIDDARSHAADVFSGRSTRSVGVFARFQAPQGGRAMTGRSAPERSRRLIQTPSSPGGEIVIAVTQERHDRPYATTRRVIRENEENSGFAGKQNATVKSSDLAEFPSLPSHPQAHATAASRQSLTSVVSSSDSSFVFKEVCAKKPMPETTMLSEHCADYVGYWSDDGDDECSVRDELEGQIHFPHSVSTYGPSFWMDDGEIEHGRWPAQSECCSSAPTHGHSTVQHESNGYDGDGSDAEDAWMRARAQGLARLRARKVVRREGGLDGL
ncbi:hypothetical protein R3P38DRAFT_2994550 [Favolaschia claudopus]|uniref:Uncharacterized protein n=1 Tax=Favolaschia claudopus TaxID=2862362 RepID=A0AAW0AUT9_9AGAR